MTIDVLDYPAVKQQQRQSKTTSMIDLQVVKRNGTRENFTPEKIHKPLYWAARGLTHISISAIEVRLSQTLVGRKEITSDELHETLISVVRDLISTDLHEHDILAGRLITYQVRKHAYNSYNPPKLRDIVKANAKAKRYDPAILNYYTDAEWKVLESFIVHDRDDNFRYAGAEQMRKKYLAKDRTTKKIYESYQIPYILIPAILFKDYPQETRMEWIKTAYDALSLNEVSLATPPMAGIRTRKKQFSSCVLLDSGDNLESINATDSAATLYVASKAGLGINAGRNRGLGSSINDGDMVHTGLIPFIKKWTASVKSCSQGGVRDGAVTFFFPMWHYEFPELVLLKDPTLLPEHNNLSADYCFQINKYLIQRLVDGKNITLFSPGENETPGLYESYFDADQSKFKSLYEKYEKDPKIRKRSFPAHELFNQLAIQRSNTGRIYVMFIDNVLNGPFKDKIYQSNLCMEILQATHPLTDVNEKGIGTTDGEVSLCTLGAVNIGTVQTTADLERRCTIAVRLVDAIIDYQDYPVAAAEASAKYRRNIGIGLVGFAHFLASKGLKYNTDAAATVDEFAEAWAYYVTKASVDLAEEMGPCPGYKRSKYSDGWTPNLSRVPFVDSLVPYVERMPWDPLRQRMVKVGIRNSVLMALMPVETSSQPLNETNGVQPARGPIVTKTSKDGTFTMVVPEYEKLNASYDWEWDQKSPQGYLSLMSVLQKYVDQGISTNTSYNPKHFPNGRITTKTLIGDLLFAFKAGLKTLYYNNTRKPGESDFEEQLADSGCADGVCKL